jgi:pentose-5-phosphate-3-epimerase
MEIIPAILEKKFEEIVKKLDFLSQIEDRYSIDFKFVQIDLCDGKFVNNETWLPDSSNQEEITKLLSYKNYFNLEFHLMCEDQLKYFLEVENFKPKSVVIHLDEILFSKDLEEILNRAKKSLTRIIATAKLDFLDKNREEILSLLYKHEKTDLQIMGIEKIGLQGQEFSEKALALVRYFRNNLDYKDLSIQIDGSMNENTISFATKAGADKFIVGSYLVKDLEEEKFVANLRKLRRS